MLLLERLKTIETDHRIIDYIQKHKNLHGADKKQTQRRGPRGKSGTRNGSKRRSQRQKLPKTEGKQT